MPSNSRDSKPKEDIFGNTVKNKRSVKDMPSTKLKTFNMVNGHSAEIPFTDGALHDPLALFPLLRRQVKLILCCVPVHTDPMNVSQEQFEEEERDLARYFGVFDSDKTNHEYKSTVFERARWNKM